MTVVYKVYGATSYGVELLTLAVEDLQLLLLLIDLTEVVQSQTHTKFADSDGTTHADGGGICGFYIKKNGEKREL